MTLRGLSRSKQIRCMDWWFWVDGMAAYVDANFRVGLGPLVVEMQRPGRGKATQRVLVMGDVDNNGRVDYADALLVMAYSLDPSVVMPNGGDIRLGDVNGDGVTNMADAQLIVQQITDLPGPGVRPPPEAGLLTIPPVTLTVGSSYSQWIKERSSPVAGEYYYDISSSDPTVADGIVNLASRASDDGRANEQWGAMVIIGVGLGTAQVTLKSTFGDPQTIPVTVEERPPSIDSVPAGQPKTENITLVFYKAKGVLDSIEQKIPWYYLGWRLTLGTVDLLLEWLGFGSTEVEREQAATTWVEYAHDDDISYALSQQSVELYKSTSGLREEAFVVLQDAKKNVLQDVVLALVPGLLSWPATAISIIGDLQMYASILDVVLANELKSTKAELYGLLAPDGSIIEGNSYRPFLMMKNDEADRAVALDLRLHVTQAMDIESVGKKVRVTESTDFGPITVPAGSGYQILSNQSRVFADEEKKDLTQVEVSLSTGFYNQVKKYRVRDRGPALAVEEVWASAGMFDTARTEGSFKLGPNDQFTLRAKVLNRSELYASSASAPLRYYCSADLVIDPSADLSLEKLFEDDDDLLLKGLVVAVEPLGRLGETEKTVRLPAPRLWADRTGTEVPGTCWASDLSKPVYYGVCVWDEVEEEYNACSLGVPVEVQ